MIGGVCGGLAEYLKVDPTIVRLGFVLLGLWSGMGIHDLPILKSWLNRLGLLENKPPFSYINRLEQQRAEGRSMDLGSVCNSLGKAVRIGFSDDGDMYDSLHIVYDKLLPLKAIVTIQYRFVYS